MGATSLVFNPLYRTTSRPEEYDRGSDSTTRICSRHVDRYGPALCSARVDCVSSAHLDEERESARAEGDEATARIADGLARQTGDFLNRAHALYVRRAWRCIVGAEMRDHLRAERDARLRVVERESASGEGGRLLSPCARDHAETLSLLEAICAKARPTGEEVLLLIEYVNLMGRAETERRETTTVPVRTDPTTVVLVPTDLAGEEEASKGTLSSSSPVVVDANDRERSASYVGLRLVETAAPRTETDAVVDASSLSPPPHAWTVVPPPSRPLVATKGRRPSPDVVVWSAHDARTPLCGTGGGDATTGPHPLVAGHLLDEEKGRGRGDQRRPAWGRLPATPSPSVFASLLRRGVGMHSAAWALLADDAPHRLGRLLALLVTPDTVGGGGGGVANQQPQRRASPPPLLASAVDSAVARRGGGGGSESARRRQRRLLGASFADLLPLFLPPDYVSSLPPPLQSLVGATDASGPAAAAALRRHASSLSRLLSVCRFAGTGRPPDGKGSHFAYHLGDEAEGRAWLLLYAAGAEWDRDDADADADLRDGVGGVRCEVGLADGQAWPPSVRRLVGPLRAALWADEETLLRHLPRRLLLGAGGRIHVHPGHARYVCGSDLASWAAKHAPPSGLPTATADPPRSDWELARDVFHVSRVGDDGGVRLRSVLDGAPLPSSAVPLLDAFRLRDEGAYVHLPLETTCFGSLPPGALRDADRRRVLRTYLELVRPRLLGTAASDSLRTRAPLCVADYPERRDQARGDGQDAADRPTRPFGTTAGLEEEEARRGEDGTTNSQESDDGARPLDHVLRLLSAGATYALLSQVGPPDGDDEEALCDEWLLVPSLAPPLGVGGRTWSYDAIRSYADDEDGRPELSDADHLKALLKRDAAASSATGTARGWRPATAPPPPSSDEGGRRSGVAVRPPPRSAHLPVGADQCDSVRDVLSQMTRCEAADAEKYGRAARRGGDFASRLEQFASEPLATKVRVELYEAFGIPPDASAEEVRSRVLSHPLLAALDAAAGGSLLPPLLALPRFASPDDDADPPSPSSSASPAAASDGRLPRLAASSGDRLLLPSLRSLLASASLLEDASAHEADLPSRSEARLPLSVWTEVLVEGMAAHREALGRRDPGSVSNRSYACERMEWQEIGRLTDRTWKRDFPHLSSAVGSDSRGRVERVRRLLVWWETTRQGGWSPLPPRSSRLPPLPPSPWSTTEGGCLSSVYSESRHGPHHPFAEYGGAVSRFDFCKWTVGTSERTDASLLLPSAHWVHPRSEEPPLGVVGLSPLLLLTDSDGGGREDLRPRRYSSFQATARWACLQYLLADGDARSEPSLSSLSPLPCPPSSRCLIGCGLLIDEEERGRTLVLLHE